MHTVVLMHTAIAVATVS